MVNPDVILLECIFSSGPGQTWVAQVRSNYRGGDTLVQMIDPDEDDQIMWEKTVLSSSNYAGLVSVLVDPSTEGGVPADAMNEVKIRGITGWKADFLFLCWCRDENNSGAIPMHLAGFSNAQLEDLHSRTDCFRDLLRQTELRGQVYGRWLRSWTYLHRKTSGSVYMISSWRWPERRLNRKQQKPIAEK